MRLLIRGAVALVRGIVAMPATIDAAASEPPLDASALARVESGSLRGETDGDHVSRAPARLIGS